MSSLISAMNGFNSSIQSNNSASDSRPKKNLGNLAFTRKPSIKPVFTRLERNEDDELTQVFLGEKLKKENIRLNSNNDSEILEIWVTRVSELSASNDVLLPLKGVLRRSSNHDSGASTSRTNTPRNQNNIAVSF